MDKEEKNEYVSQTPDMPKVEIEILNDIDKFAS